MKKNALSLALALVMILSLAVTSYADGSPYVFKDNYVQITNAITDTNGEVFEHELTCTAPAEVTTITGLVELRGSTSEDFAVGHDLEAENWEEYENPPFLTPFIKPGAKFVFSGPGIYYVSVATFTKQFSPAEQCYYKITVVAAEPTEPQQPTAPAVTVEDIPASGTAIASTQTVTVDGKAVEFQMYALADANGNLTNYIKLRDMAYILNGTKAQFSVGYDGTISLTTGQPYEAGGTEMTTPYSGDRAYTGGAQTVKINGADVAMTAITLTDDDGGGYNYFKLRDLGKALGFNVSWDNGVIVESDKPYTE
jgi:hypothetical protein